VKYGYVFIAILAIAAPVAAQPAARLTDTVNPFIGTGGHGHTYPGPSLPFGMIQPGPDTRLTGWDGCSGYHYSDSRVYGFSHTHLSGTGIPDYTDVLLMPMTGEPRLNNGADGQPGYSSTFSHDEEIARPGYYAVTLKDHAIRAELTTTLRVGMHRYGLPAGRPAHVILDLEHRDRLLESSIEMVSDREVAGVRRSRSWARDQVVYFVIRFSRPFAAGVDAGPSPTKRSFDFGTTGEPLLVKVAISAVSVEGARKNMDAELPGWDFESVRSAADAAWERELSKIRVEGGTSGQRTVFYTALYHAMLAPNVYMDVDGQYRGRDFKIHRADGFTYYTVFSLWDTFRALHPLLTLIDKTRTRDFIQTFLRQYEQGGRLPVWELAANETDTMIGYHAVPVIADAVAKGIDGFDLERAYRAMVHSADEDRAGLGAYKRAGFIDASEEGESVSRTLEYAYDDWTIAQVARRLGRQDDYQRFLRRSKSWKHLLDPATGFMRARVEGFWASPFDAAEVNSHYTEANAWQYSFFVPHDLAALIRMLGGPEQFVKRLDALFSASSKTTGREQADITGLIGQYAHGNEPSHHMAYLYSYAGQPWKTQAMVRRILDQQYSAVPDGLSGNEDCGQMSAWYVFSALGFYPVTPGSSQYVIGAPLFDSATIRLESGAVFTVRSRNASPANMYIQQARLNGGAYDLAYLEHLAISGGGEVVFDMGPEPNVRWASGRGAQPSSSVSDVRVVAAPFIAAGVRVFRGSQPVRLRSADAAAVIHYTIDGSTPDRSSPRYSAPFTVSDNVTVKAIAFIDEDSSPVMSVPFRKLTEYPKITLSAAYAPQYAAAGRNTLIDGLRGNDNFRTGRWQGYLGKDLEVTLDFGEARDIKHVAMGFLEDRGSWIFFPRSLSLATSQDGVTFEGLMTGGVVSGVAGSATADQILPPSTREYAFDVPMVVRARYIRVRIEHYGKLPAWHPGAGSDAWLFTDEIIVR
jgi:predicted alpha-1,2-mannosidase